MKQRVTKYTVYAVIVIFGVLSSLSISHATIISTDVAAGMSIRYLNSGSSTWITDATASSNGLTDASVDIIGSTTGLSLHSSVNAVIDSPNQVTTTFNLRRNGTRAGPITTSGYSDAVWGNRFHLIYYADLDSVLTYSWNVNAPGMLSPAPFWGMADVFIDTDQDLGNGFLQRIRSGTTPGSHVGSAYFDLLAGNTYEFYVAMYHSQSFDPNYDISNVIDSSFTFDFSSNSVPEPSTLALLIPFVIGTVLFNRSRLIKYQ